MTVPFAHEASLKAFAVLILASLLSLGVQADPSDDGAGQVALFGEEDLVIEVATKSPVPLAKAPGSVTVITRHQIDESGARSIPELLRVVAGVNVRWNPMVQTIDIRGFGQTPFSSRVLVLIDGVPYNSWNKGGFPQHPGVDFFVLQNIKRLEVVKGSGSSLYGENAYWGVINIVTMSGEDLEGGRVELFTGDRDTSSVGAMWGKSFDGGSILFSARGIETQFPTGFWYLPELKVEAIDLYTKLEVGNLTLSYYRHEDEAEGFSTPVLGGDFAFTSAGIIEQTVEIASLAWEKKLSSRISFSADLGYATRDGSYCGSCHSLPLDERFASPADHGSQLIADVRLDIDAGRMHDILIGIESRSLDRGRAHEIGNLEIEREQKLEKTALYFQDQISLSNDRLNLVLGARYDGSSELFDSEVSPRIAAVWNPTDPLIIRGGWSRAVRFPTFTELYENAWFLNAANDSLALPLFVFLPNPDLLPEEISTVELGAEYRFNTAVSGRVDVYQSTVENFIVLSGFQSVNHPDDADILGGEVELRFSADKISGFFNYSYQDNEQQGELVDQGGRLIEFVYSPQNKASVAAFVGPFGGFRGSLEMQWRDDMLYPEVWNAFNNGVNASGHLEGYTLTNLRFNYDFTMTGARSSRPLRISAYVRDVFDEAPTETVTGIDGRLPGREFFLGLEARF